MQTASRPFVSRLAVEIGFALFTAAFGATIIKGALEFSVGWGDIGPEAGYFPFRVGLVIVLTSAVTLFRAIRHRGRLAGETFLTREQARRVLAFAIPLIALVGVVLGLGLYVGAALYLLYSVRLVARHRSWLTLAVSLGTPVVLFILFEYVFLTPLLKGPLENWLGWY
jgi:hypothetical protein